MHGEPGQRVERTEWFVEEQQLRVVQKSLGDLDPARDAVPLQQLVALDRWAIALSGLCVAHCITTAILVGLLASVWLMAIAPAALRAPMDGVLVGAGLWAWARWRWPSWGVVLALLAGHGLVVALRG